MLDRPKTNRQFQTRSNITVIVVFWIHKCNILVKYIYRCMCSMCIFIFVWWLKSMRRSKFRVTGFTHRELYKIRNLLRTRFHILDFCLCRRISGILNGSMYSCILYNIHHKCCDMSNIWYYVVVLYNTHTSYKQFRL